MRESGVRPQDIIYRPVGDFKEKGLNPEIVMLRFEVNEQNRKESVDLCRHHRSEIIRRESANKNAKKLMSNEVTLQPIDHFTRSAPAKERDWMEEEEEKRIKTLVHRQTKEIKAQLKHEVEKQAHRSNMAAKAAKRKAKEQEQAKAREQASKAQEEKRLKWIEFKAKEAEEKQIQRNAEAEVLAEKEARAQELAEELEFARKREHLKRSVERERKKEQLARRNKMIHEKNLEMLEIKTRERQKRELEHEKQLLARKRYLAELNERKAQEAARRVNRALEESEAQLEQRRQELSTRMRKTTNRLQEFEVTKTLSLIKKKKLNNVKEQKRKEQQQKTWAEHQTKMREVESRQAQAEQNFLKYEEKTREENEFRSELARLNRARKTKNVERLKRREEYKRNQLIHRVQQEQARINQFCGNKETLLRRRQENQIKQDQRKRELIELFDTVKLTGDFSTLSGKFGGGFDDLALPRPSGMDSNRSNNSGKGMCRARSAAAI